MNAAEMIDLLVDAGGWEPWDDTPVDAANSPAYDAELRDAAQRSGSDESVRTGRARMSGVPVVLVVSEFGFLGGSIGRVAGYRIVAAVRRATAAGLAVVGLPSSGGTRMQEGTPAFLQMAAITGAVTDHRAAGLPYLIYLRHPTTGGVFASWGSLGHLTWAEPGALVGFLGPRVVAGLTGVPIDGAVQRAEHLARHALIDAVVPIDELRGRLGAVLVALSGAATSTATEQVPAVIDIDEPESAWAAVVATRQRGRVGVRELLTEAAVGIADGGPILLSLAVFGSHRVLVVGQDGRRRRAGETIGPEHLRLARRGLALAAELALPVVTVIDTPGAQLSVAAEEQGVAGEIARCTAAFINMPTPTVSVLLGQGGGGAALALFPADRRIAVADSWLSPLPPEGASLIVYRDTDHAAEVAEQQHILATELARLGVVDTVVDAPSQPTMPQIRWAVTAMLDSIDTPSATSRTRVPTPDCSDGEYR